MSRNLRITVFVNDEEHRLLRAVCPDDESLGRTVRRLALDRARWMADHGKQQRGRPAAPERGYYAAPQQHPHHDDGGYTLDRSDSQL